MLIDLMGKRIFLIVISLIALSLTQSDSSWNQKAYYSGSQRWSAASFSIGDTAYVGTGSNKDAVLKSYTRTFYQYTPKNDVWNSIASLPSTS